MRRRRRRRLLLFGVAAGLSISLGTAATAAPAQVSIGGNYAFSSSVITGPGLKAPRHLNAYQSAVFVQSWLVDAVYGHPQIQDPPPSLTVYRVDVTGDWGGTPTTLTIYYAANATTVWIDFPHQPIVTTPTIRPPKPAGWFVAESRVRDAFAGTAKLELTGGILAGTSTTAATTTTTTAPAAATSAPHRSSRAVWLWLGVGLAFVAAAGLVVSWLRDRQRAR